MWRGVQRCNEQRESWVGRREAERGADGFSDRHKTRPRRGDGRGLSETAALSVEKRARRWRRQITRGEEDNRRPRHAGHNTVRDTVRPLGAFPFLFMHFFVRLSVLFLREVRRGGSASAVGTDELAGVSVVEP